MKENFEISQPVIDTSYKSCYIREIALLDDEQFK